MHNKLTEVLRLSGVASAKEELIPSFFLLNFPSFSSPSLSLSLLTIYNTCKVCMHPTPSTCSHDSLHTCTHYFSMLT